MYRKQGQNWQTREGNQWKPATPAAPATRPTTPTTRPRPTTPTTPSTRPTTPGDAAGTGPRRRHPGLSVARAGPAADAEVQQRCRPGSAAVTARRPRKRGRRRREAPAAGAERIMSPSHRAAGLAAMTAMLALLPPRVRRPRSGCDSTGREVAVRRRRYRLRRRRAIPRPHAACRHIAGTAATTRAARYLGGGHLHVWHLNRPGLSRSLDGRPERHDRARSHPRAGHAQSHQLLHRPWHAARHHPRPLCGVREGTQRATGRSRVASGWTSCSCRWCATNSCRR